MSSVREALCTPKPRLLSEDKMLVARGENGLLSQRPRSLQNEQA